MANFEKQFNWLFAGVLVFNVALWGTLIFILVKVLQHFGIL